MTDFIKKGDDPNTAWEKAKGSVRSCRQMLLRSSTQDKNNGKETNENGII